MELRRISDDGASLVGTVFLHDKKTHSIFERVLGHGEAAMLATPHGLWREDWHHDRDAGAVGIPGLVSPLMSVCLANLAR